MTPSRIPGLSRPAAVLVLLALGGLLLVAACTPTGGGGGPSVGQPTPAGQTTQPPAQAPAGPTTPAAAKTVAPPAPAQTTAPPASATLNACSLLTKQEVEAAIGTPVLQPQPKNVPPSGGYCGFNDPEASTFALVSIVVSEEPADAAKASFELQKKNPVLSPQAVASLGDDAYWVELMSSLEVLKGRYTILIDVQAGADQDRQNIAKGLASKAIGRLP